MEEIFKILLVLICIGIITYCFIELCLNYLEIKRLNNKIIRNSNVYEFRLGLLKSIGLDKFKTLASYDEMLDSDKPLQEEYWIVNNE